MIQCISSQIVGGAKSVLGLLGGDYDLVQGEGILIHRKMQVCNVLAYVNLYADIHIAETCRLKVVFSWLDILECEFSLGVCCCPQIIGAKSYDGPDYRNF